MKKPSYRGLYLNDHILYSYIGFGIIYPELYKNFKQKIIDRIIARIWYLRVQKAKQHKLAYFWESSIKSMESICKEWRLKGGI